MNYPEFSDKGEVICQECGVGYKIMTGSHTRRKHGMSIEEYKAKYPGAPNERVTIQLRGDAKMVSPHFFSLSRLVVFHLFVILNSRVYTRLFYFLV